MISTAREQLTVPKLICGRKYDYEVTLQSCNILTQSIKCAVPRPTYKEKIEKPKDRKIIQSVPIPRAPR